METVSSIIQSLGFPQDSVRPEIAKIQAIDPSKVAAGSYFEEVAKRVFKSNGEMQRGFKIPESFEANDMFRMLFAAYEASIFDYRIATTIGNEPDKDKLHYLKQAVSLARNFNALSVSIERDSSRVSAVKATSVIDSMMIRKGTHKRNNDTEAEKKRFQISFGGHDFTDPERKPLSFSTWIGGFLPKGEEKMAAGLVFDSIKECFLDVERFSSQGVAKFMSSADRQRFIDLMVSDRPLEVTVRPTKMTFHPS